MCNKKQLNFVLFLLENSKNKRDIRMRSNHFVLQMVAPFYMFFKIFFAIKSIFLQPKVMECTNCKVVASLLWKITLLKYKNHLNKIITELSKNIKFKKYIFLLV